MEPTDCMELLRLGHSDFLGVPLRSSEVIPRLKCIIDRRQHVPQPIEQLKEKLGSMQIVGQSPALRTAVLRIPLIARCNATVLITGETGTGKEVFARAIHYLGPRSGLSFVPINCGAIPVELVENGDGVRRA